MAKCTLCGETLPGGFFATHATDAEITKALSKCEHDNYDSTITYYCTECIRYVNDIKHGKDFESAYRAMKKRIITSSGFFSTGPSANSVKNYISNIYSSRKQSEERKKVNNHVSIRWNEITKKYGDNFVFPSEEKQRHICVTKVEENFVLVENSGLGFNTIGQYKKNANEKKAEYFLKQDDESLFAISLIPLENIVYFQVVGNVEHTTVVSGGEVKGGGVNTQGAAMGALLFGGVGAVVGSQIGTEVVGKPIKSKMVEHDQRKTFFVIKNKDGKVEHRELPYYYSEVFMKVIPEKEYSFVQANSAANRVAEEKSSSNNIVEEMKRLKELLDLDLITQEDFDTKKKQLLGL